MEVIHRDTSVVVFQKRFEETLKRLTEGGRTAGIRAEHLENRNGHLSCIVTNMYVMRSHTRLLKLLTL